jgi:hypothetical protein
MATSPTTPAVTVVGNAFQATLLDGRVLDATIVM